MKSKPQRDTTSQQLGWIVQKIKIKIKNKQNQKIARVGKDVEKSKPLCTLDGNVKWCSHCGRWSWCFLKELNMELPNDPAILFLRI